MKKTILLFLTIFLSLSLFSCKNNDENRINYEAFYSEFNLDDEELFWTGSIDDEFTLDAVIVVLKNTLTYPKIKLEYFNLSNAVSFRILAGRPPEIYFTNNDMEYLLKVRQIIMITISPTGKDEVIKTIKKLEKEPFIRTAAPNSIHHDAEPIY